MATPLTDQDTAAMAEPIPLTLAAGDKAMHYTSYAGAGVSVATGMTLTEWGVVVGILTALLTFIANMIYQARKDRREQQRHEALMERIKSQAAGEALEADMP